MTSNLSKQERLAALRNKVAEKNKSQGEGRQKNYAYDKFYPFYKADIGKSITVRYLPDRNEKNPLFYAEKVYHEIEVNGKKHRFQCHYHESGKTESCPCCLASQDFYARAKEAEKRLGAKHPEVEALKKQGWRFYKRVEYVANIVVIDGGEVDPNEGIDPESPVYGTDVRILPFRKQIYECIQSGLTDPELLTAEPHDFEEGHNFMIKVTAQGENKSYNSSGFRPKPSALDPDLTEKVIGELYDLSEVQIVPRFDVERIQNIVDEALGNAPAEPAKKASGNVPKPSRVADDYQEEGDDEHSPAPSNAESVSEGVQSKASSILNRLKNRQS